MVMTSRYTCTKYSQSRTDNSSHLFSHLFVHKHYIHFGIKMMDYWIDENRSSDSDIEFLFLRKLTIKCLIQYSI